MSKASLDRAFAAVGFGFTGTGGNCTAYMRMGYGDVEMLVTSLEWDHTAPSDLNEPCMLTVHPPKEDEAVLSLAFSSVSDLLKALRRGIKECSCVIDPTNCGF